MYSNAKDVAKEIRKVLKENFPGTKFSVTSHNYDCVHVDWFDLPCYEPVNKLLRKFEYGTFDGMEDIYNNDNYIDGLPQCKYVLVQQDLSDETMERGKREIIKHWNKDIFSAEETEFIKEYGWYKEQFIARYVREKMKNNEW